ncbi:hypothetical protein [Actinoallomurus sp. CA-142502]|uniref:hypothetical protein n=1 Tax=Actinoallomurus sp. CA-142502 TaxID=3239885 RepID=UPI003D928153
MTVTDEQVAALRAFLASEPDEAERLTGQLVEADRLVGYGELVHAAFVTAVRRRFSPSWSIPEVIGLVATVRAQLLDDGIHIDPRTSESLMRHALGDAVATDLEKPATARAQVLLLGELIVDEGLDDAGLDEFLAQARTLADRLMSGVTDRR